MSYKRHSVTGAPATAAWNTSGRRRTARDARYPPKLHPRIATRLDRVVHLEAPEELLLRRVAARELPLGQRDEFERTRRLYLPAQARFEEALPPAVRADLVVDGANPLGEA